MRSVQPKCLCGCPATLHHAQDHMILGVGTAAGFEKWHIYADFGDVLTLDVEWSCGNPFYYGYGFDITVIPVTDGDAA